MNGQSIGASFFHYLAQTKPSPMQPGERHAVLFADDEFVIDHDRKIITLPTIGDVGFEPEEGDQPCPAWIAGLIVNGSDVSELVPGYVDPFSEEAKAILPTTNGHIRAMPYWVLQRAAEPRTKKLLAQYMNSSGQKRGGFRALLGRRR